MTKQITTLFFVVLSVMLLAIVFLGFKISNLNDAYYSHIQGVQGDEPIDSENLVQTVRALEAQLKEQKEVIAGLSVDVIRLTSDTKVDKTQETSRFMLAPEYEVNDQIFTVKQDQDKAVAVVGDRASLKQWMERNELFLEYVMKKSMPLEYEKSTGSVVVRGMINNSVFYQMGLREGDKIVTVNGKKMSNGMDLRNELITKNSSNVVVVRDKQQKTIQISYSDSDLANEQTIQTKPIHTNNTHFQKRVRGNEIVLNISKEQFNEVLDQQMTKIRLAPTAGNSAQGVKIMGIDDVSVFSLMDFKAYDVITKVGGNPVSQDKLASAFEGANNPVEVEFVRADRTEKVLVKFNQN